MAVTALITLSQGSFAPAGGVALLGSLFEGDVAIGNDNNADVQSWSIEILDVPPGSAVATGVLASGSTATPIGSFTPDVPGSYRIKLTVNGSGGDTDIDIRVFSVPFPNKFIISPPYQKLPDPIPVTGEGVPGEKPNETNFGAQARGWMGDGDANRKLLHQLLAEVDEIISLPDPTGAPVNAAAGAVLRPYFEPLCTVGVGNIVYVLNTGWAAPGTDPKSAFTKVNVHTLSPVGYEEYFDNYYTVVDAVYDGSSTIWLGVNFDGGGAAISPYDVATGVFDWDWTLDGSATFIAIDFGEGYIWTADTSAVKRTDPSNPGGSQTAITGLGTPTVTDMVLDTDTSNYTDTTARLWVTDTALPGVRRIDTSTLAQDATLTLTGITPMPGIAVGGGFIWVVGQDTGAANASTLYRINPDPLTSSASSASINAYIATVIDVIYDVVTDSVYVYGTSSGGHGYILKVDPSTLAVTATEFIFNSSVTADITAGVDPPRLTVFRGHLWVVATGSGSGGTVKAVNLTTFNTTTVAAQQSLEYRPSPALLPAIYIVAGTSAPIGSSGYITSVPSFSANVALTLPYPDYGPSIYRIYDDGGTAGTWPITVSARPGHNINGAASAQINLNYGSLTLLYDGGVNWRIL